MPVHCPAPDVFVLDIPQHQRANFLNNDKKKKTCTRARVQPRMRACSRARTHAYTHDIKVAMDNTHMGRSGRIVDVYRRVYKHVYGHVYKHVYTHVYRHVRRHVHRHVYRHEGMEDNDDTVGWKNCQASVAPLIFISKTLACPIPNPFPAT